MTYHQDTVLGIQVDHEVESLEEQGVFSWTWTDPVWGAKWRCYVNSLAITRPGTDFYSWLLSL